jgi:tetratricopeptide (TPR) repeat protein
MKINRIHQILAGCWICLIPAVYAQTEFHPSQVNFAKDTTGYGELKAKEIQRAVQGKDITSILRFLELEIESGMTYEAIATLEDWQKKDGGTAMGLFLLGTAYGTQGNMKKALMALEEASRRNKHLGNNTLKKELQFLRIKANPLGRPQRVNGVFTQNSLEQVRKSQSTLNQVAVWKQSRQELYNWLQERAWVYKNDPLWISWMCMDMGEFSYLLNEPELAMLWYKEAEALNSELAEPVAFRLKLMQTKTQYLRYVGMAVGVLLVVLGLWVYFRSQRAVEASGK